jgi:hypothetical protein
MATPKYRKDLYQTRREIMRMHLNHGDIKRLAEKVVSHYPEVTQSNLSDYANYLSQVFNPRSTRPFKDELARQIEAVWEGLNFGDLDNLNVDNEYRLAMSQQFSEHVEYEIAELANQRGKEIKVGYKEDSVLPRICLDALQWRMHQKYPTAKILINERLKLKSGNYVADLVVTNSIGSPPVLIIETGTNNGHLMRAKKESHLAFLLSESGAEQGLLAILDKGEIIETWL